MKSRIPRAQGSASAAQCVAWVTLLVLIAFLSLRGWGSFQVGAFQDDAIYSVLARSIAFGDHYGLINAPGFPPASKFPFGFPLFLAPVVRLWPDDPLVCTVVPLLATLLNVSLLFWGWPLLSPRTSRWWGLGSAWLYGLSPRVMGQTRMVMSEPLFTSLVLLALILTELRLRHESGRRWLVPALGVVLMLVVFTRWVGVVVCVAVLVRLALAALSRFPRWCAAIIAGGIGSLAVVLVVTPIDLRQLAPQRYLRARQERVQGSSNDKAHSAPNRKTLTNYATDEIRKVIVAVGGGERENEFARRLGTPHLPAIFSAAMTILVAFGVWCSFRRGWLAPSIALFEALYGCTLAWWPFITPRHLYPLLPFMFVQLLIAIHVLATAVARGRSPSALPDVAVVVTFVLLSLGALWKSVHVEDSRALTGDLQLAPSWLASHSNENARVMTQFPQATYLYARRSTIPLPEAQSAADLENSLLSQGIDYMLLEPDLKWRSPEARAYSPYVQQTLLPIVADLTARGRLVLAYAAPDAPLVRVYRVTADAR